MHHSTNSQVRIFTPITVAVSLLAIVLAGCDDSNRTQIKPQLTHTVIPAPSDTPEQIPAPLDIESLPIYPEDGFLHAKDKQLHEKRGRIVHMGWSKSAESYNAGGSDYYVLVEDTATPYSNLNRTTLRITKTVPTLESFLPFVGKRVLIRGRYAAYYKVRVDPNMQQLSDYFASDQQHWRLFGGGFLVDSIELQPDEPANNH